jgi:hypothetical protein
MLLHRQLIFQKRITDMLHLLDPNRVDLHLDRTLH